MAEIRFNDYKSYQLDVEKLRECSVKDIAPILSSIYVTEDFEFFEDVKHLLKIPEPEPSKSLDEIQSDLKDKIDSLISNYRELFRRSSATATYHYGKKCDAQNRQFEFAKEYGYFPSYHPNFITVAPDSTTSVNFVPYHRFGSGNKGYFLWGDNVRFYSTKRPNFLVRKFLLSALDVKWVDSGDFFKTEK